MKLKVKTKLSYGVGGLADNALFTLIETFLLFFLTTVAGIQPATAGAILAVGCLWEAFCGPISGFLSDNLCFVAANLFISLDRRRTFFQIHSLY